MNGKILFGTLLACSVLIGADAETEPSTAEYIFSRRSAIDYALLHNLELEAARTVLARAQAQSIDAGRLSNPELGFRGKSDFLDGGVGEHNLEIGIAQRFPVTDRLSREREVAAIEIELAQIEIEMGELQLAAETAEVYFTVQAQIAKRQLEEERLELTQRLADFLETRVLAAEASPLETKRLRMEEFQIGQELADLEIAEDQSRARLADLLGLPAGQEFTLNEILYDQILEPLPPLAEDWLTKHPAYRYRALGVDLASEQISLARAGRWGDVGVELFFESKYEGDNASTLERENLVGLGVGIPLPILQQNRGKIEASRADRREAALRLEAIRQRLHREARLQAETAHHAREHLKVYTEGVSELMEESLSEVEMAYAQGQIDFDALLRLREQTLEIRQHQIELHLEYANARIQWAAATGQLELL
ncbi:MAG: TolC family protein [Puniceicoccales bacterium]